METHIIILKEKKKSVAKEVGMYINNIYVSTLCMNRKESSSVQLEFDAWTDICLTAFPAIEKKLYLYIKKYNKEGYYNDNKFILDFHYPIQINKHIIASKRPRTYFSINVTLFNKKVNTFDYYMNNDALDAFKLDMVNFIETEMGGVYKNKK
jgi:hypothetical protein